MRRIGFLNKQQRQRLAAICATLIPPDLQPSSDIPDDGGQGASLAQEFETAMQGFATPDEQRQIQLVLGMLGSSVVNGVLSGQWKPFEALGRDRREQLLLGWMTSRMPLRRQAFQALKRLALFLYYAPEPGSGRHWLWREIDYPDPPLQSGETGKLQVARLGSTADEHAEVIVVGSGAGGSVVAAQLAAAGHEVLVLEKGKNLQRGQFGGWERQGYADLYEKQGALTTADLSMVVLAGSALGGGTVVNWSTSLPTPEQVRHEWATEYGLEGAGGEPFDRSQHAVLTSLNVGVSESEANAHNRVLEAGAAELGFKAETVARNVRDCVDCTFCPFGCRHGAKQSALETWLPRAQWYGARILTETYVDRIEFGAGQVEAVHVTRGNGEQRRLRLRAKSVVVAAGAIHTPALLRRSGLINPHIGRNLRLHPVTAAIGEYSKAVPSWDNAPQTRMLSHYADLDGGGYGVRFEVAPAHPGLWASAIPWQSADDHAQRMRRLDRLSNIIVITRDRGAGRVRLDAAGNPVLDYKLHPADREHLMQGLLTALRLQVAAGALEVSSGHSPPLRLRPASQALEPYLRQVQAAGLVPNRCALFSAHQMGSARIGASPQQGAVRPDGRTWERAGVYVSDASVFPTASGVNPMISIMTLAHMLAGRIVDDLA